MIYEEEHRCILIVGPMYVVKGLRRGLLVHSLQKGENNGTKQWVYSIISRLILTLLNLEIEAAAET